MQRYTYDELGTNESPDGAWSPWNERLLRSPDAPEIIQCKHCLKYKPATALHFRNIRTTDRFRTTCRRCEVKGKPSVAKHHRSFKGQMATLRNDPRLPDAVRAFEMAALPKKIHQARVDAGRRTYDAQADARWETVRKILVVRRHTFQQRIARIRSHARRHSVFKSGLAWMLDEWASVRRYVDAVLELEAKVIQRLRTRQDRDAWRATVGEHEPPAHWMQTVERWGSYGTAAQRSAASMRLSPWEFTTRSERDALKALHPETLYGADHPMTQQFERIVDSGNRTNGTLKYHIYPGILPPNITPVAQATPDWLRPYNGYTWG